LSLNLRFKLTLMKRIVLFILLALAAAPAVAQLTHADSTEMKNKKVHVEGGFYAGYFQLENRGFSGFGGMLHIGFREKFTLNYSLLLGTSNTRGLYVHATGGMVAGLWVRDQTDGERFSQLAFLLCVLPEGVGMYLPKQHNIQPHISVNPLSFEYYYRSDFQEWGKLGCDVVARFKIHPRAQWQKLYIAPQIAATYIYTPGQMASRYGVKAGVTIGAEAN